jgi:hypothetical protein
VFVDAHVNVGETTPELKTEDFQKNVFAPTGKFAAVSFLV